MFPKYGGTKVLMAALGSSLSLYFPEPCDPAKYLRFFSERTSMAKKSFVRKTQRTIVGAAKSSAARIQKVAVRAATAAATAAAEAAVEAVMRSLSRRESTARGRKTAVKKPVRKTKRKAPRKTSRKKRL
jgi:hypothetical protein